MVAVAIDLAELQPRIERRFELLARIADELVESGYLDRAEVALDEASLLNATESYYLLSEAYKAERLPPPAAGEPPHRTEPPKIAALSAFCVMQFRPFRFVEPVPRLRHPFSFVANQTFALMFASSLLDEDFAMLTLDMRRRLYNFLQWARLGGLDEYRTDQMIGTRQNIYVVNLANSGFASHQGVEGQPGLDHYRSDLPVIDMLVVFFELFWKRPPPSTG